MRQIRNRLLSLVLVLGILCSLCPSAFALHQGDSLWWTGVGGDQDYRLDVDENGQVHSQGQYVLFTSDVHRYAYLAKDLLETANGVIQAEEPDQSVGLMAFGGDFANEYVLYEGNMRILKAALGSTPATYTKGNHEGNVADADFEAFTGMSRIGETAINDDGYYHFFNFGAESNSQAFAQADIDCLKAQLETWDATDKKPIVIVSHFPLHYYNDRRSTKQADQVVEMLNQYPQAIFLWGHNHTEQDPNYGMIRVPGDLIQTGAKENTSKEINFTYACLGALRDGTNGANGLLAKFNGDGTTTFRYIKLNAAASDTDTWTDAQGNENAVRYTSDEGVSSTVTAATPGDYTTINVANVLLQRPLVGNAPAETANAYTGRFAVKSVVWTTDADAAAGASFDFDTVYKAAITLEATDGYTFANDAVVSVNKQYQGPMPGQANHAAQVTANDGKTVTAVYTFDKTVAKRDPIAPAAALQDGVMYAMVATDGNMAASYIYDPAQHGEESRPEYTVSPADVVVQGGNLVSDAPGGASFVAQRDGEGFMLWSDYSLQDGKGATTLNYLSMATRGPEQTLQAGETLDQAIYADWYLDDAGRPYLNVDGGIRYAAYAKDAFGFTDNAEACNVRLYPVSSNAAIYNVAMNVPAPVAGQDPVTAVEDIYGGYTVTNVQWSDGGKFAYNKEYTVTATVQLKQGHTFGEPLTGRVSGNTATVTNNGDGTATLTYTFGSTGSKPALTSGLQAKEVSQLKDGGTYVIVAGNQAMSALPAQGIYLSSAQVEVSGEYLVGGLTKDLFFTATASDGNFALGQNGTFLGAKSTEPGSPDVWGFENKDKAGSAIAWSYADGVLTAESTGAAGPGGPPPGGPEMAANTLYLNGGHFNFSTFNTSAVKIYEVVNPFEDVNSNSWSYPYIYAGAYHGITQGVEKNQFGSAQKLSRGMAVTMLYRVAGSPEVSGTLSFRDTQKPDYYTNALLWAVAGKIVVGYDDSTFRPDQDVTREELFKMAGMAFGDLPDAGQGKTYADAAKIGDFAVKPIENLTKAGVLQGYKDNTIRPQEKITREEAIKTVMAIYDLLP